MNRLLIFIILFVSVELSAQKQSVEQLYNLGKYAEVIQNAQLLISKGSNLKEVYFYKGLAEKNLFKYAESAQSLKKAVYYNPENIGVQEHLAMALQLEGNSNEAISCYNKILAKDSTKITAKSNLALLYKGQREYMKASDLYTQLIAQDSTNGYYYAQLAFCCDRMGYALPVIAYYEKAVELNPNDYQSTRSLVSELVNQKYYERAIYYVDSFLVKYTNDLYLLKQKAYVLALSGRYLDAVEAFKYITELGDSTMFTFKYYGQSLYNNGQYEEAVFWLDKFIAKKPDDFQNQLIMGLACQNDYQYEKSLKHLKQAMLLKFDRKMIARVYSEMAKTEIMYGDYRGFRDSTPDKANALYQAANDNYLKALEIELDDWKTYKDLGVLYETKIKDFKIALYYYEKYYKELNPHEINEFQLDWIQRKISSLKEEVHFIGD